MEGALFAHIGGKNGLLGAELLALTPEQKPDIYIEPFGGSFGLGIKTDYSTDEVTMVHNELDSIIHYIFKSVSEKPKETLEAVNYMLSCYDYSQATVDCFRNAFDYLDKTGSNILESDVRLGAAGWILKEITYNGNCKKLRKTEDADIKLKLLKKFERREETAYRLEGIRAFNMDAMDMLSEVERAGKKHNKKIFIYVDAPYSHSGKRKTRADLYRVDIDREDRKITELAELLENINKDTNCKIMVSEYDSPIYDSILTKTRGWEKIKVCDVYKSMAPADCIGCKPIETEYIWRNYRA